MRSRRAKFSALRCKFGGRQYRFRHESRMVVAEKPLKFASQIHKARAASSELEYLLLLSMDLGYLQPDQYEQLREDVVTVRKMLSGLLKKL